MAADGTFRWNDGGRVTMYDTIQRSSPIRMMGGEMDKYVKETTLGASVNIVGRGGKTTMISICL